METNGQLDSRPRGSRSTIRSINVCIEIFNPDTILGSEEHSRYTREINRQNQQPERNYRQAVQKGVNRY